MLSHICSLSSEEQVEVDEWVTYPSKVESVLILWGKGRGEVEGDREEDEGRDMEREGERE